MKSMDLTVHNICRADVRIIEGEDPFLVFEVGPSNGDVAIFIMSLEQAELIAAGALELLTKAREVFKDGS